MILVIKENRDQEREGGSDAHSFTIRKGEGERPKGDVWSIKNLAKSSKAST